MLRDNLVGLIEPIRISAGVDPLALSIQKQASDDRSSCLENPRPEGAESSLTENVTSPFQAEPAQKSYTENRVARWMGALIVIALLAGTRIVLAGNDAADEASASIRPEAIRANMRFLADD